MTLPPKQQLVVDEDQVDELLDGEVGIGFGDVSQRTLVAAILLPDGNNIACLVVERRLDWPYSRRSQFPGSGGTSTPARDDRCEIRIEPLPRRHVRQSTAGTGEVDSCGGCSIAPEASRDGGVVESERESRINFRALCASPMTGPLRPSTSRSTEPAVGESAGRSV